MKVLIIGEGLLAEYVNERLSQEYEVIRQRDTATGGNPRGKTERRFLWAHGIYGR